MTSRPNPILAAAHGMPDSDGRVPVGGSADGASVGVGVGDGVGDGIGVGDGVGVAVAVAVGVGVGVATWLYVRNEMSQEGEQVPVGTTLPSSIL